MSRIFDVSCDGYPAFYVSPIFPFCPPAARTLTLRQHEKPLPPRISTPEAIIGLERGQKTSLCTAPSSRPPERTRRHQTSVQQPAAQDEGGEGRIEEESTPSFDLAFVSRMKSSSGVEGKGRRRTAGHYPMQFPGQLDSGSRDPLLPGMDGLEHLGNLAQPSSSFQGFRAQVGPPCFLVFLFVSFGEEERKLGPAGRPAGPVWVVDCLGYCVCMPCACL